VHAASALPEESAHKPSVFPEAPGVQVGPGFVATVVVIIVGTLELLGDLVKPGALVDDGDFVVDDGALGALMYRKFRCCGWAMVIIESESNVMTTTTTTAQPRERWG
jgi:hypothetical protein